MLPQLDAGKYVKEEKKKEEEEEKKVLPRTEMTRNLLFAPAHHHCLARFSVRILINERIRECTTAPPAVSYLLAT